MPWKGAQVLAAGLGDNAAGRLLDEPQDSVTLRGLREIGLNVLQGLAYIHSLEVDGVIDILDLIHLFLSEAAAKKPHAVYAFKADGITACQNIRRDVLGEF